VSGHNLRQPPIPRTHKSKPRPEPGDYVLPNNPLFGPPSVVKVSTKPLMQVPISGGLDNEDQASQGTDGGCKSQDNIADDSQSDNDTDIIPENTKVRTRPKRVKTIPQPLSQNPTCIPVSQRWFYEPGLPEQVICANVAGALSKADMMNISQPEPVCPDAISPPSELGEMEPISEAYLDSISDDESGAWRLQGILFYDDELKWCRITGSGTECGVSIV
jgi:hypothetical protein